MNSHSLQIIILIFSNSGNPVPMQEGTMAKALSLHAKVKDQI